MNKKLMSTMTVAGLATLGGMTNASADTKYTIEKGDTLSHIALNYATSVRQLATENNIENPDLIFAGETLWINGVPTTITPRTEAPVQSVAPQAATPSQPAAPQVEAPVVTQTESKVEAPAKTVETPKVETPQVEEKVVEVKPESEAPVVEEVPEAKTEVEAPIVEEQPKVETPKVEVAPVEDVQVPTQPKVEAPVQRKVQVQQVQKTQRPVAPKAPKQETPAQPQVNTNLSVYERFLNAGGTSGLWNTIVMPESGGNPNAVSPNGYRGLGQTKEAWGTGSVEEQTAGLLNYAAQRYGSVSAAIAFRVANGWW